MSTEKESNKNEVSRRDFLVGAGAVVASGAIATGALAGCGGTTTETVTSTATKTVTSTVTSTVGGTGATATVTKTVTTGGTAVEPWQEPEVTHYMVLGFH